MRISNYNKEVNKILSEEVIYKADMKHTTWSRSGWDNDVNEYKFSIEAKTKYELEKLIKEYTDKNYSSDGDFGISLSGSEYEVVRRYTKEISILD